MWWSGCITVQIINREVVWGPEVRRPHTGGASRPEDSWISCSSDTPCDLRCTKVPTILLIPYLQSLNLVGIGAGHECCLVPTSDPCHTDGVDALRTGDQGLFGPSSVTWQMHGDPMMWVAGDPRALPPGPAPPRRPGRPAEFRLPARRLGPPDAHRELRRHGDVRHHRGRRAGRLPGSGRSTPCSRPPTRTRGSGTGSTSRSCCCGCTAPRSTPICTSCAARGSR